MNAKDMVATDRVTASSTFTFFHDEKKRKEKCYYVATIDSQK